MSLSQSQERILRVASDKGEIGYAEAATDKATADWAALNECIDAGLVKFHEDRSWYDQFQMRRVSRQIYKLTATGQAALKELGIAK